MREDFQGTKSPIVSKASCGDRVELPGRGWKKRRSGVVLGFAVLIKGELRKASYTVVLFNLSGRFSLEGTRFCERCMADSWWTYCGQPFQLLLQW